jgi:methyl-accepting chemotaxis protein
MSNNRRNVRLINKKFQIKLIIKFIILNFIILGLFASFLHVFLNSELEANLASAHVSYKNIKEMLFPIVLFLTIFVFLLSSIIITVIVFYFSFRIAGPWYRFNSAVKDISNRNLRPVTEIRQDDQMREFSDLLGEMCRVLSGDFHLIKENISAVKNISSKGQNSGNLKEITNKINKLENIMNKYII